MSKEPENDVFLPSGGLRLDGVDDSANGVLKETLKLARETHWDSVRSPHVFMGLLAAPDAGVHDWGERLGADLPKLLGPVPRAVPPGRRRRPRPADPEPRVPLRQRHPPPPRRLRPRRRPSARPRSRRWTCSSACSPRRNSIVAECFERIGVTAAKLTELAVIAELKGNEVRPGPS